jgi:ABC-type uncharacterized transport system auxiliary subunit
MSRWMALLVVLAVIAGCVHLRIPAPEVRNYRLDYPPPTITGARLPVVLRIAPLGVAAIYDRQPIVYREDQYSTGTYFSSRWSATPGSMIADLLARDIADSKLYRAVEQGPSVLPSDYMVTGEIEEIEERTVTTGCAAHLRLRITVVPARRSAAGPVLMNSTYSEDEPSPCDEPRALAEAMSRVLARVSAQMQHDVYEAVAADVGSHSTLP